MLIFASIHRHSEQHQGSDFLKQLFQYQLMGGMVDGLEDSAAMTVWMRQNLAMLEGLASDHDNFKLFVADGEGHCSLSFSSAVEETCVHTLSASLLSFVLTRFLGVQRVCGVA